MILASSSPQRQELLKELGEPFEVRVPDVDETLPDGDLEHTVQDIARRKVRAVARTLQHGTVLAANLRGHPGSSGWFAFGRKDTSDMGVLMREMRNLGVEEITACGIR